jgi:hypothetical protein
LDATCHRGDKNTCVCMGVWGVNRNPSRHKKRKENRTRTDDTRAQYFVICIAACRIIGVHAPRVRARALWNPKHAWLVGNRFVTSESVILLCLWRTHPSPKPETDGFLFWFLFSQRMSKWPLVLVCAVEDTYVFWLWQTRQQKKRK